jgi:regulator of protease activity HflC (stomatin/prohibitin superfamily)
MKIGKKNYRSGMFYSVGTDEMGLVKRFGKYNTATGPGLHMKLPF